MRQERSAWESAIVAIVTTIGLALGIVVLGAVLLVGFCAIG